VSVTEPIDAVNARMVKQTEMSTCTFALITAIS